MAEQKGPPKGTVNNPRGINQYTGSGSNATGALHRFVNKSVAVGDAIKQKQAQITGRIREDARVVKNFAKNDPVSAATGLVSATVSGAKTARENAINSAVKTAEKFSKRETPESFDDIKSRLASDARQRNRLAEASERNEEERRIRVGNPRLLDKSGGKAGDLFSKVATKVAKGTAALKGAAAGIKMSMNATKGSNLSTMDRLTAAKDSAKVMGKSAAARTTISQKTEAKAYRLGNALEVNTHKAQNATNKGIASAKVKLAEGTKRAKISAERGKQKARSVYSKLTSKRLKG